MTVHYVIEHGDDTFCGAKDGYQTMIPDETTCEECKDYLQ